MRFDIKNPDDWSHIMQGEILEFVRTTPSRILLSFNATDEITVWVSNNEEMESAKLLGVGSGLFEVSFTLAQTMYVQARTTMGAIIFFKGHAPSQRVPTDETPAYTNLAPRGRPSDLSRMMYIMSLNEREREKRIQAEVKRLRGTSGINPDTGLPYTLNGTNPTPSQAEPAQTEPAAPETVTE